MKETRLSRACMRLTIPKQEYPLVDSVVVAYCGFVLLVQILLQISPFMTFLATTPFYSIQTYLGLLGGALIVVDFFTTKKIWQGKYSIFLYAILVLAAIASVRMISYGMKENLFKLCWAAVQFVLVYSCAYRMERETLKKYVKVLYFVLLLIWLVGCCVSLYQYVNQIGYKYVVNPLAKDSSSNRQGFYENRLFGIFYTLNHAAYISLYFFLAGIAYIAKQKRVWVKICLIASEFILLCHIILSGSRSAFVSLVICAAVMAWFMTRNAVKGTVFLKITVPIVASVLVATLCVYGYQGMKTALAQVPYVKDMLVYHIQTGGTEPTAAPTEAPTAAPTEAPTMAPTEAPTAAPTEAPTMAPTEAPAVAPTEAPIDPTIEKPELDEDILERDYLEEDTSNGRFSIWKDYISLYQEVGAIGLSPGNYMPYIMENHPELYVVEYIRVNYPDKYESGIIHHVHSGYIMVYVSAGILGFLCLVAFICFCLIRTIRIIMKNKRLSYLFIGAFALVVAGAVSAVFDEGLFFQNNPQTTVFWFALGVLLKEDLAEAEHLEIHHG